MASLNILCVLLKHDSSYKIINSIQSCMVAYIFAIDVQFATLHIYRIYTYTLRYVCTDRILDIYVSSNSSLHTHAGRVVVGGRYVGIPHMRIPPV